MTTEEINENNFKIDSIIKKVKMQNKRINEKLLKDLFKEAITNRFNVIIEKVKDEN